MESFNYTFNENSDNFSSFFNQNFKKIADYNIIENVKKVLNDKVANSNNANEDTCINLISTLKDIAEPIFNLNKINQNSADILLSLSEGLKNLTIDFPYIDEDFLGETYSLNLPLYEGLKLSIEMLDDENIYGVSLMYRDTLINISNPISLYHFLTYLTVNKNTQKFTKDSYTFYFFSYENSYINNFKNLLKRNLSISVLEYDEGAQDTNDNDKLVSVSLSIKEIFDKVTDKLYTLYTTALAISIDELTYKLEQEEKLYVNLTSFRDITELPISANMPNKVIRIRDGKDISKINLDNVPNYITYVNYTEGRDILENCLKYPIYMQTLVKINFEQSRHYNDKLNLLIPSTFLNTNGILVPYYALSIIQDRKGNSGNDENWQDIYGAHLNSGMLSPNIGRESTFNSVCTGDLSKESIKGLKTLSHANLRSPYFTDIVKEPILFLTVEVNKNLAKEIYEDFNLPIK